MPPLPLVSGREVVKAFESLGWTEARQAHDSAPRTIFIATADRSPTSS